jgi:hypothetical protein
LNLTAGDPGRLFIQDSALEKASGAKPKADFFIGKVTFNGAEDSPLGESSILYYPGVPLKDSIKKSPEAKEAEDDRGEAEKLADTLFEARLAFIRTQRASEEPDVQKKVRELAETLIAERPAEPEPVFEQALLLAMDAGLAGKWWKGRKVEEVDPEQAEAVLSLLDEAHLLASPDSVAAFLGAPPQAVPGDVEGRHAIERQKKAIEADRKQLVLIAQLRTDVLRLTGKTDRAWEALAEVARWEDKPGETTLELQSALYEMEKLYGLALEALSARLTDTPFDVELLERRIALYRKLGWERFAEAEERKLAIRKAYQAMLANKTSEQFGKGG